MTRVEKALLDHAPNAVFWTRKDGFFAYVNHAACANLGYERVELLQRSIFEIDSDMSSEFWKSHWSNVARSGIVTLYRFHRRRDDSLIPVEVQVQQITVNDEIVHFSFVRDLTEERKIEAQRRSHLSYLNALFEESPVPQLIIDPETGRIVEANPAATEFYGYDAETLCAMQIQQINLMPVEEVRREMQRAHNRELDFFRFQHTDAGNGIHDVHVFSVPILRNGKQMLHSTILDVTEIVESRHDLLRYKELVERLPVGAYQATPGADGVILAVNPAFCQIFEFETEQEVIGRSVASFYANPEQRAELSRQVMQSGEIVRAKREAVTASGQRIWISITSHAAERSDGQTVLQGAIEDITDLHQAELEVERANARATNALQAAPIPMVLYTSDGCIEAVNRAWCEITGYTPNQLKTLEDWTRLAHREHADTVLDGINNMIAMGKTVHEGNFEIRCANGEIRCWSFYSGPIEYDDGAPVLWLSAATDVTEERRHEHRMRQAEAIIQSAYEGITITDRDRNIERVNAAFTRITGYTEAEVLGKNPRVLSSGRQDKAFYQEMWSQINESGHWQGEIWNRRKNGEIYPEWLSVTTIPNQAGEVENYAGVFADLSELRRSQTDLEQLQNFDLLTGLPNRRMLLRILEERLAQARKTSDRVAVLVCGLDRFRMINESYSYSTGDRVLKSVTDRLHEILDRRTEVARHGSDQFVFVIGANASTDAILDLVDRIALAFSTPIQLGVSQRLHVQFTSGIARFPDNGGAPKELLRNAESAMFHAKRSRRGSYAFYSPSQTRSAQETLALETEMRQTIEENAFAVHLQPVISVASGAIVGAEALARWPRSGQDSVSPEVFIPLAEQSGLIDQLSFHLLEKACQAVTAIPRQFAKDFRLAFNISALQLNEKCFVERITNTLAKAGLTTQQFELELTESTLMEQASGSSRVLKQLRRSGMRISIDDFGTGFSSLAYLQEIDAQVLKIDRRFIRNVSNTESDAQIVASIIAMAHALDMDVVAEGVETTEQLEFLRRNKCDYYQGYLFSKPLPMAEFQQMYRAHS